MLIICMFIEDFYTYQQLIKTQKLENNPKKFFQLCFSKSVAQLNAFN